MADSSTLSITEYANLIVAAAAFLGAFLGIVNTWQGFASKQAKLVLRPDGSEADLIPRFPTHEFPNADSDLNSITSFTLCNLSEFPLFIVEIGSIGTRFFPHNLCLKNRLNEASYKNMHKIPAGDVIKLPISLHPREVIRVSIPLNNFAAVMSTAKIYVKTSCGVIRVAHSYPLHRYISVSYTHLTLPTNREV